MDKVGKILIIDDDEDILQAARLLLKQHVAAVDIEKKPSAIPTLLKNTSYDVIFLDMNFARSSSDGAEGFHWLRKILEIDPNAVVILITAFGDVAMAVRAIKEGAVDFILKPWHNEKFLATLFSALQLRRSRLEASNLRSYQKMVHAELDQPYQEFVGRSSAMQHVFSLIEKVAATDANVLILGENGTGKELVARELHRQSRRADRVFVAVDMGAITETLFESELFGHVKGAFTDARENRAGRFEIASGGTIFLDEIGNIPLTLQAKLLRVLETRTVTRIGANQQVEVDVRIICATNMPIYDMVAKNKFRQDLLYRINTVEIELPPLRQRTEDIPPLADHFLAIYGKKYHKSITSMHPLAHKKLAGYPWPGNVRELSHVIERAVIMSESATLQASDFFIPESEKSGGQVTLENLNMEDVEKLLIRKALDKFAGNISHAADELGLSRAALYRRIEKYGL